jgi:hypothetical protein
MQKYSRLNINMKNTKGRRLVFWDVAPMIRRLDDGGSKHL